MVESALICVAAVAVMVGVVLQRITGIGFGIVSVPPLVLLLGPVTGVQVIHPLAAACSLVLLGSLWRQVHWRRAAVLTAVALAATPFGVVLAFSLPAALLQVMIAMVMLAAMFTANLIARARFVRGPLGVIVTGAVGGLANGTVGQAGPFIGAYAIATHWELTRYVASMQACWIVVNVAAMLLKGVPSLSPLMLAALGASLVVGYLISAPISKLVTPATAQRCIVIVALVGSLVILGRGLLSFN